MRLLLTVFTAIALSFALVSCGGGKKGSSRSIPVNVAKLSASLHDGKAIGVSATAAGLRLADGENGGDAFALDADGKVIAKIFNIDDPDFKVDAMYTVKDGSLIVLAYVYRYDLVEVLEGGIEVKEIAQFELPNGKRSLDDCLGVFRMQRDGSIDCAVDNSAAFNSLDGAYLDNTPLREGTFKSDAAGNIYMFGGDGDKLYKIDTEGKDTVHIDSIAGDSKVLSGVMSNHTIVYDMDLQSIKVILADGTQKDVDARLVATFDDYIVTNKGLYDANGEAIALTPADGQEIHYDNFIQADLIGNQMRVFALLNIVYIDLAAKTVQQQAVNNMIGVEAAKVVFLENDVYLAGYTGLYRVSLGGGLSLTSGATEATQIANAEEIPNIGSMVKVGDKVLFSGSYVSNAGTENESYTYATGSIAGDAVTVNAADANIGSIQAL